MSTNPAQQAAAVLYRYADRGVFLEFEERAGRDGVWTAEFRWMLPRRLRVVADPRQGRLACPDLLLDIEARSPLRAAIDAFLEERHAEGLPEHRRIDPSRAKVTPSLRARRLTLALRVADDRDWAYATGKLVNVVHELVLFLNMYWTDYAHRSLGAPQE
ncbi:hypothetical protein MKK75_10925 [Methylobacterium sp. J-030]|uniref:hypothetical protein n=1 Tax=Methylobacterium sp. J-030 TaxID=2836627 RepID=UPI001FB8E5F4|nr:hypothetical protein [Methylobacterium sp. J-030]MCJ2069306.1 hypothetical protein [Methylobacterium sp. J-030]